MLFGLELEFFVKNKKGNVVIPREELHQFMDAGGVLVEARGKPMDHPVLALASLKLAQAELTKAVRKNKRWLLWANEAVVTPASLRYAQSHKKTFNPDFRPVFERFRNPVTLEYAEPGRYRAGLHIHFSQPDPYVSGKFQFFDMLYPIRLLDQEFETEIHTSGRLPGAYRMKPPYGFEYRSLPATVDQRKVVKVLSKMLAPREFEMYPDHNIPSEEEDDL